MINVIDEVLNTGATENKVKYTLTHADGTTELVQLDLATPVTTVGTPLNKALFDSIKTDINSKLNTSAKASNTEVVAGTNDTKYITPAKLLYKMQQLNYTPNSITSTGSNVTGTLYDGTQLTNSNSLIVTGKAYPSATLTTCTASLTFNGTGINGATSQTIYLFNNTAAANVNASSFIVFINKASKTINGIYTENNQEQKTFSFGYTTLTSVTALVKGDNASRTCTLTSNVEGIN